MVSLNCSSPSLFLKPPQPHATGSILHARYPKATTFRSEWPDSTTGSVRLCESKRWVPPRSVDRPKSARTEAEIDQITQSSEEEEAGIPNDDGSPPRSFLSVLCPLLKFFGGGDPSRERNAVLEVATSSLASLARLPWGRKSLLGSPQHEESTDSPLLHPQIYEFEACPFCRRVREALTDLDLTVEVYPCPKGSVRHRQMVQKLGGKEQFPFLVDPSTGITMYESELPFAKLKLLTRIALISNFQNG